MAVDLLSGPGGLRRAVTDNSSFGGSLLSVRGESLRLQGVTIDGRGSAPALAGRLYGWLVEVNSGQLTIGSGTELKENKNSSRKSDGGGAVCVRGGVCVLDGGTIRNNTCVTGGAGVRIDSGVFYMKSGQITGNRVCGVGAVEGFDGRGGGVLNHGTAGFYGGSVSSNTVTGVHSGGRDYGGVGGGLANTGDCILKGTVIRGNTGSRGDDIGAIGGKLTGDGTVSVGEIWLRTGQVFHVGSGFCSGGVIRLTPEEVRAGVPLVSGLSDRDWKKSFSSGINLRGEGLILRQKNGVLTLAERPDPTPTPTPTLNPAAVVIPAPPAMSSRPVTVVPTAASEGRLSTPVPTENPVRPTYLPVRMPDPEAEIKLATVAPETEASAAPAETGIPFYSYKPAVTEETPEPSAPSRRALPWYLIYPMQERVEVYRSVTWHFSREEIREWKKEFREKGLRYDEKSCRVFMEEIRENGEGE